MINATGTTFEAVTDGWASGLVGTIGVRIRDNLGNDTLARTTAGISEDIPASGIYRTVLATPTQAGQYTIVWDAGGIFATEDLNAFGLTPGTTLASTLIQRCRRFMIDWPENDVLTASATGTSTLTVADATIYGAQWLIQVDQEIMQVKSGAGTTLTVLRGARGSQAVSHNTGATVLFRPRFMDLDYLEALNSGIDASFPWVYQPVIDESMVAVTSQYEYTVPTVNGHPIPYISKLEFLENGDLAFRPFSAWAVLRGGTPKIKLRRPLPNGVIRVYGFAPVSKLADLNDTLSPYYPIYLEDALTYYACQHLLAAGEAARSREDTGPKDARENANRPGTALQVSNALVGRFQKRLMDSGLPPMPKHITSVL